MIIKRANELLKEIGNFLEMPDLAFNSNDSCLVEIKDQLDTAINLEIKLDVEQQRLVMILDFDSTTEGSDNMITAILTLNALKVATTGAWITFDPEENIFSLADEFFIPIIKTEEFNERLEQFFDQHLTFQEVFNNGSID